MVKGIMAYELLLRGRLHIEIKTTFKISVTTPLFFNHTAESYATNFPLKNGLRNVK